MMLNQPGTGRQVTGELYEVDDEQLVTIDRLESVGIPGNLRLAIEVETLDGTSAWQAFAYMKGSELARPLHTGYLGIYNDRRFVPFDRRR
jgi:gamma-glutamylaminecyclotransferase